jgi:4-aminobutyrate aminotransferase-like enzyme
MPNSVVLAPPCTVTHEEIDIAIDALDDALREIDAMCD